MIYRRLTSQKGATLVELLVIMSIVGILTRLVTLNVFRGQQRASLTVTRDMLVSDLRKQQLRAMEGVTAEPGVYLDYSVRFESNKYVLYPGVVYDEENSANEMVTLDPVLQLDPTRLSGGTITFSRLSGEIRAYDADNSMIVLRNTQTGNHYTIQMNSLGVPFVE